MARAELYVCIDKKCMVFGKQVSSTHQHMYVSTRWMFEVASTSAPECFVPIYRFKITDAYGDLVLEGVTATDPEPALRTIISDHNHCTVCVE